MLKVVFVLAAVTVGCLGDDKVVNTYLLYTKNNNPQTFDTSGTTLPSNFNTNAGIRTIILVHGHGGSSSTSLNPLVTEAILQFRDPTLNVIVVDWEKEASYSYSNSVKSVPLVAQNLATFIKWFVAISDAPAVDELHLVGFGLGAHVVGIASRQLSGTPGIVGRITGLDPSGSQWGSGTDRLKRDDAKYVEVIHTDGSGLLSNGIGTDLGDIDFYINGGSNQPGCLTSSCSHNRAYEIFAASMFNTNLEGAPCSSTTQLKLNMCRGNPLQIGGIELSKSGSRVYRLNTSRNYPF